MMASESLPVKARAPKDPQFLVDKIKIYIEVENTHWQFTY
jgi:hypothetical protein